MEILLLSVTNATKIFSRCRYAHRLDSFHTLQQRVLTFS